MQSTRRPPSAVILGDKHRTGVLVCQAESCRGVIGAGDFALEVATGKPFHYKCFVSAGAGDEKYAELTTRYTESSRWRGRYCSELVRQAHQEQCVQHARQHWRLLWHNTPSELQVRFSPWSRPQHGSLCDAQAIWCTGHGDGQRLAELLDDGRRCRTLRRGCRRRVQRPRRRVPRRRPRGDG